LRVNQFKHRIFDDIQGLVEFSDAEKRIVDSPLFQRLRRIKQLGLAYLVFPGAMHTRFYILLAQWLLLKELLRFLI